MAETSSIIELGRTASHFVKNNKILLVDPSLGHMHWLRCILEKWGTPPEYIYSSDSYAKAEKILEISRPMIILAEYDLNSGVGPLLTQSLAVAGSERNKIIFGVISANTSDAAAALAGQQGVDFYLLKPLTPIVLALAFTKTIEAKTNPSQYTSVLEESQEHIAAGRIEDALNCLELGKKYSSKPTLCCFMKGEAHRNKGDLEQAQAAYEEALALHPTHYGSLNGLYEIEILKKNYDKAYATLKRIAAFYPLQEDRLITYLKLATVTKHFEDIESTFERLYPQIESIPELRKVLFNTLLVCAKHRLQENDRTKAISLLQLTVVFSHADPALLLKIIEALTQFHLLDDAKKFLTYFPESTHREASYLAALKAIEFCNGAKESAEGR